MSLPRFGVTNPVPVNLIMAAALIGGIAAAFNLTREFFPDTTPDSAMINLPYPGATPQEVEEGMAIKVEDAIANLDDVDRITTTLSEGGGGLRVEFYSGIDDVGKAVDDIQSAVDKLRDLPDQAEKIDVSEFEPQLPTIMITLFGTADEESLKRGIHAIRDDLESLPGMGQIDVSGVRDYEIRVNVAPSALLEHRLSLPQISNTVSQWMADMPGGSVRTGLGDVAVRTIGVPEKAQAIREIVIKASDDGQFIRLGDIATVREFYVDDQIINRFNGQPAVSLTVFKTGNQDAVKIAEMARAYVAGIKFASGNEDIQYEEKISDRLLGLLNVARSGRGDNPNQSNNQLRTKRREAFELGQKRAALLPASCGVQTHSDLARFIEGRLDLLTRNAMWGALLVFLTLLIFLNWRVAIWVGVGLVIALCGTLVVMQIVGITLNLLTMFGLIVVMGLLVDDAIVVAENIQARHDRNEPALVAAIKGTEQVFWPVVATVLTSIVAFMPLRFIQGQIGDLMGALPLVVMCALSFSLIESILILPSHMGHSLLSRDKAKPNKYTRWIGVFESKRDNILHNKIIPGYGRLLEFLLRYRYATFTAAVAALFISLGLVRGGHNEFTFLGRSDSETLIVNLRMPIGTPIERTDEIVKRIENAATSLDKEVKSVSSLIGVSTDIQTGQRSGKGGHVAQIFVELHAVEERQAAGGRESSEVIAAIREKIGVINDLERLTFGEIQGGFDGPDITLIVSGPDDEAIEEAASKIKQLLTQSEGVFDVGDDNARGQREVQVSLKAGAANLGLNVADVANQVRGALYGLEPHVYSADREDIKVRVRLDEETRHSLYAIENMYIITPDGRRIPLSEIADIVEGTSYSIIHRIDRARAITITAATAPKVRSEMILGAIEHEFAALEAQYPGLEIEQGGQQRQMAKAFSTLPMGFLVASIFIYSILAWMFGSYLQPLAVMLAVPFSIIGVIWGHYLLGFQMTFLSLIGFVALSGVVVNDSLILVDLFNTKRKEGMEIQEALIFAGRHRLRPIFLTTVTTILGLTPLMLETSFQAKFLIPMAVSISCGLMSATFLILIVLPCILVIMDDFKGIAHYLWYGLRRSDVLTEDSLNIDDLLE